VSLIKNPVLSILQSMIGISPTPAPIVLDDTNVSLTLPLVPNVTRRSLSGIRTGWYQGVMENVHSAADTEQSTLSPYTPGDTRTAPWPEVVPEDFDVWLLRVQGLVTTGAGTLDEGWIRFVLPPETIGVGVEDDGTPIILSSNYTVARFTDIVSAPGGLSNKMLVDASGEPSIYVGTRLPRGCQINFATTSVTASVTFRALLTLGLFPAGLGQDVTA